MDITPLVPEGRKIIKSYGNGRFNVSDEHYHGSIIILPEKVLDWPVEDFSRLSEEIFADIIKSAGEIEILLLGSGASQKFLDPNLARLLKNHDISVECMDTGAACRTYNVLLAEERKVAAALINI